MCSRTDDPSQHDLPGYRLYDLTYAIADPRFRLRRARVWAESTDEARSKAKALDPEFLATTMTPRIVR